MPLLSLVIPTLDRQEKVIRAVNSILSQNFKGDLEVIVVDDGSSPPITLPPELASDPRARIVRKERTAGPGAARNTGLTLAGGEWAGFLDSDDYLLPDTLNQRFADAVEDQRQRNNPLAARAARFSACGIHALRRIGRALPGGAGFAPVPRCCSGEPRCFKRSGCRMKGRRAWRTATGRCASDWQTESWSCSPWWPPRSRSATVRPPRRSTPAARYWPPNGKRSSRPDISRRPFTID